MSAAPWLDATVVSDVSDTSTRLAGERFGLIYSRDILFCAGL